MAQAQKPASTVSITSNKSDFLYLQMGGPANTGAGVKEKGAATTGNVSVFCRFRPLNAKELALGEA